ncbi:translocation/assembly module TamB domain-containing protein [Moraxella sp. Tifton1]|uniref:translocation/assembly module TamB domain-containing protein n=1 Tax=Moraxella oculi TaxID=2940516 RepID=UPI0020110AD5|nr:translocation/assembly module TamB domain-containing protein [Moraxella sp. Tifton1]MCL1623946.1 translocation/assembly module TamB domain-containing protein [Moraxella sp. Tifton1]
MTQHSNNTPNKHSKPTWLVYLIRTIIASLVAIALMLVLLFYAMGTQSGTKFLLEKIALETGTGLTYTEGNLRDGVWVSQVTVAQGEDVEIHIDRAYVQLGWRAILARQVHLVDTQIDKVEIVNKKPPTGEPFDYATINLPVSIKLENTHAKQIVYRQATKAPVYLHDIRIKQGLWSGTKVHLNGASIRYDNALTVSDIDGNIELAGDYPLNLRADVAVSALNNAHVGTLHAHAQGTLKRTVGTLSTKYNDHDIKGEFVAQGMDDDSPFSAKLEFDEISLPYATEQNIMLHHGTITAEGVVSRIELRINTDLVAKDIPSGRYRGRGLIQDGGMEIPFLRAETPNGTLFAKGQMSWVDDFELQATLSGQGYQVREALPVEYREYEAYLPQTLTGELGIGYHLNDDEMRLDLHLNQNDGEEIAATLVQSQNVPNAPWHIDADWRNLVRTNVPNLDSIRSTRGSANIRLEEGYVHVDAHGSIQSLSVAPAGDYAVKAIIKNGDRIHLSDFHYHGVVGGLSGKGSIDLATPQRPLAWQFDLTADKLMPNAYFNEPNKTPFQQVSGQIVATGRMREMADGTGEHDIDIKHVDLMAGLTDNQTTAVKGLGHATVLLKSGEVRHFDARFDGDVRQSFMPNIAETTIGLDVSGDLNAVNISRLHANTDSGKVSATGRVDLRDGVGWEIQAKLDEVDTKKFAGDDANLMAVITGNLMTSGHYRDQTLVDVVATFDGQIEHDRLPKGELGLDIKGDGRKYHIDRLDYRGGAGQLQAKGFVDISDGYAWDLMANANHFDIGAFVEDVPSELTGDLQVHGHWQDSSQLIAIEHLNLHGSLRNQPFHATGSLVADLALPNDLVGYFNQLKTQTPKNIDELLALRGQIDEQARRTQNIIKHLNADRLSIKLGDNAIHLDGDKSELTTSVSITDLSQVMPSTTGAIKGGVILLDDGNSLPTLYVDMVAGGVRTANVVVQEARVLGKIVNLGNADSQMLIDVKNIIAMGQIIKMARLDFQGVEQKHTLAFSAESADNQIRAKVEGSLDRINGRYLGVLSDGVLHSRFGLLTQSQPTEFSYQIDDGGIALAAHCWQSSGANQAKAGSICLQDTLHYSPSSGDVDLVIKNLDTTVFSAVLPKDIRWQSTLNGHVKASWQQNQQPSVNAALYSDDGRVGLDQEGAYIQMPYERIAIVADSVSDGLRLQADVAGSLAYGHADVVINPYTDDKSIDGTLQVDDINLAVIRPFLPNFQTLLGKARMSGRVGGTLKRPLFYGDASLENGAVTLVGMPLNLNHINADIVIDGTNANLNGGFMAGTGVGELVGEMDWSQSLWAKMRISGRELDITHPPMLMAKATPDIEVLVKPFEQYVDIQGVVSVPSAIIRPPESTANITTESADVTVLDRRAIGNIDQVLAVVKPWSINASIGLDLGDEVVFRGLGAKLPLAGALHLTQQGQGNMQAKGLIQVAERTKVDGIGQNLELNYAQIRFNGELLNPRLSIEGEKQIEGRTVGVRIKGTVANPEITVFNDAGLNEQQAMNALVTGRISEAADSQISEQGFRSQVTNNLAAAGLNLGFAGTRNITNQIGQAFGLESLTIDASGNSEDTSVSVTGYISPDLYIRYGVGLFNAESTLSMRYQLTRRIYVEAARATENTVDMIYRWKF